MHPVQGGSNREVRVYFLYEDGSVFGSEYCNIDHFPDDTSVKKETVLQSGAGSRLNFNKIMLNQSEMGLRSGSLLKKWRETASSHNTTGILLSR